MAKARAKPPSLVDHLRKSVSKKFSLPARKLVRQNVTGKILQRRTGKAERSIFQKTTKKSDGRVRAVIGVNASAAWYLRFFEISGRRTIRPKRKKALKIPIAGGGFIFRKRAKGFAPRPFLRPGVLTTLKKSEPDIIDDLIDYLDDSRIFPEVIRG